MNASKLLFVLKSQGAEVTSDGQTLWVEPSTMFTNEMRGEIRRLKPQLLKLLTSDTHQAPASPTDILARWRERGFILWLEVIEQNGAKWQTLQFDAPNYRPVAPSGLFSQSVGDDLAADATQLVQALEAEAQNAATGNAAPPLSQAECAALVAIITRERRGGAFLVNTPSLLACWRRLNHLSGLKLSSRHLVVFVELAKANPDLDPTELLSLFQTGLQPDEGQPRAEAPLWCDPALLCEDAEANARDWTAEQMKARQRHRNVAA